jgi:hypothetical protein
MSELVHSTVLREILVFSSNLLECINSIDVGAQFPIYCDQFASSLLPYLPSAGIVTLQDIICLILKWTPHLLKDTLSVISTIFSPSVIVKQIAFTGLIQTTLLTSHFVRRLWDYVKSVIFAKVCW